MSEADLFFQTASRAHVAGDLAEAERLYGAAITADPGARSARNNLMMLFFTERRWDEMEALVRDWMPIDPGSAELRFRLADLLLADGRYAEGWPLYEERRRLPVSDFRPPALSYPEWAGQPVGSLMVWLDQGLGDQIQFARYLPLLVARGVATTVMAPPSLAGLYGGPGAQVLVAQGSVSAPRHEAWTPICSLALHFGTTLESIPPPLDLSAGPGGRGVGLMLRGRPNHPRELHRTLPDEARAALWALPGAVSLHPDDTGATTFRETADLIAGLGLVITVDTSVAHLAGSMGKPTWLMLPWLGCDWRWLRDRTDSPWYPSMRLFRQPAHSDWASV
ncbi:MAG TPA: glycosyltransferase family 9 protein, partial [Phenylobacterium sp.]|nr:glycosyltransferase family 9 protein [Phenylobacterium sp.]